MNRRGFFGTLAGVAAAAALPLARKTIEASGYTILKLPRDWPVGQYITVVNLGSGKVGVLGDMTHIINEGSSLTIGNR